MSPVAIGAIVLVGALLIGGVVWYRSSESAKARDAAQRAAGQNVAEDGRWSAWGACAEVSPGVWKRKRTCTREGKNGGKMCAQTDGGESEQVCAPVNGKWTPVEEAFCRPEGSMLSDGRYTYYKRSDCIEPKNGGQPCPTLTLTPPDVLAPDGKVALYYCPSQDGQYSAWSACAADANGDNFKTRTCTPPENGGLPCLGEYPERVLMGNNNNPSEFGYRPNDYKASASSVFTAEDWAIFQPFQAFNNTIGDTGEWGLYNHSIWHSATTYDPTTGEYTGTVQTPVKVLVNSGTDSTATLETLQIKGEWIQLEFPPQNTPIILVAFVLTPRPGLASQRMPRTFMVCGSNDGVEWTSLVTNRPYTKAEDGTINLTESTPSLNWTFVNRAEGESEASYIAKNRRQFFIDPRPAMAYRYYRLITMAVGNNPTGGSGQDSVNIGEWKLIGTIAGTEEKVRCFPCLPKGTKLYECRKANNLYGLPGDCYNSCGRWSAFSEPGVCSANAAYVLPTDIQTCNPTEIARVVPAASPGGAPTTVQRRFLPHAGLSS